MRLANFIGAAGAYLAIFAIASMALNCLRYAVHPAATTAPAHSAAVVDARAWGEDK